MLPTNSESTCPRIFLSYRRQDDPGHAGRLFDRLEHSLPKGHVFMDVEGLIGIGADFQAVIEREVANRDTMLVIIGPKWLDLLHNKDTSEPDYVVIEITAALSLEKHVVPVLVGGAQMPRPTDLPTSLQTLPRLNAVILRSDRFAADCDSLTSKLTSSSTFADVTSSITKDVFQVRLPKKAASAVAIAFLLLPTSYWLLFHHDETRKPPQPAPPGKGTDSKSKTPKKPSPANPSPQAPLVRSFNVGEAEFRMRYIHADSFTMGSPKSDPRAKLDEPQHEVTLTKGFWLAETETTQALWEAVMGYNPSHSKAANHPVEWVNWKDSQAFIKKLSTRIPGLAARLPTEAEWEYAARAGTEMPHGKLGEMAWYGENSNEKTHPVAQKQPNAWGIHDMLGNVWEWTADAYDSDFYSRSPAVDPSNVKGSERVVRGGAWNDSTNEVRVAFRGKIDQDTRNQYLGFRFAGSYEEPK